MSAVDQLPDDLLSDILCLSAGSSINSKYAVAQVSARWRGVAFDTSLLWTRIRLASVWDLQRLSCVLARSGNFAPLYIEICGPFGSMARVKSTMRSLAPHVERIRVLDTSETTIALLNAGLRFPMLEMLRVHAGKVQGLEGCELLLIAPNVRELDLAYVFPLKFEILLHDRLEVIRIDQCEIGYYHLWLIVKNCTNLVHLTFRTDMGRDEEGWGWDIAPLRHLQKLDLLLPHRQLVEVLANIVASDTVLLAVTISGSSCVDPRVGQGILSAFLRGFGPIAVFAFVDMENIELRNNKGQWRRLTVDGYHSTSWPHIWPHLAERYGAQAFVRNVTVVSGHWNALAQAFAAFPPSADGLTLHVEITPEFVDQHEILDLAIFNRVLARLTLPGLTRVEFRGCAWHDRCFPAVVIIFFLRHIICETGRTAEVLIEENLIADGESMRELITSEGGGKWAFVT